MGEKHKGCELCKDLQVVGVAGISINFLAYKTGTIKIAHPYYSLQQDTLWIEERKLLSSVRKSSYSRIAESLQGTLGAGQGSTRRKQPLQYRKVQDNS